MTVEVIKVKEKS